MEIDFITAFGRLLRDGTLRDIYIRDAMRAVNSLAVVTADRAAALALDAQELEVQAEVLLRKRFEAITRLIPQTLANAGVEAWRLFRQYGRYAWPTGQVPAVEDASCFCAYLRGEKPRAISATEFNRLVFATGSTRLKVCFVSDFVVRNRRHRGVQFLYRKSGRGWGEVLLHFGF